MGKTALTPEFIAFMSALIYFRSPGGLADIGMTHEIWWFIIPALTAQCISMAVKILQMNVGPTTWKKLEKPAKKAMAVASIFEMIAIHQVSLMALSDNYWMWFTFKWLSIGIVGFIFLGAVKGGKRDQVETVQ